MSHNRSFLLLPVIFMASLTIFSCSKNEETQAGSIEFGMDPIMEDALKSAGTNYYNGTAALVTIVNQEGEKIYDKEYLPFYAFGQSFVTKSLKLNVGRYILTEFMLVDSSGTVTWATPAEGSRLAPLVDDPVPIHFAVYANNTTQVNPQVVRVANHHPDDFGYVNFNVAFIENFCINLYLESLCMGTLYDSLYMDPGFGMPFYASRIVIFSDGAFLTESYLTEGKNRVLVPRGYDTYNIRVFDCGNQLCYREMFGADELRKFSCDDGEFLYIECGPQEPEIIITPEDNTEPTIEQGVFGQVTDPGLDYYMLNDSSMLDPGGVADYQRFPMMTDIYIYKTDIADTVYYPATTNDCYYYPDLNIEPCAVVRTNSSGYYQLPLEEGRYSYLVKTPLGFYIDAWVSSHVPGRFEVHTGEVTILNIHVQPCYWY
jgi:hypothetical protein